MTLFRVTVPITLETYANTAQEAASNVRGSLSWKSRFAGADPSVDVFGDAVVVVDPQRNSPGRNTQVVGRPKIARDWSALPDRALTPQEWDAFIETGAAPAAPDGERPRFGDLVQFLGDVEVVGGFISAGETGLVEVDGVEAEGVYTVALTRPVGRSHRVVVEPEIITVIGGPSEAVDTAPVLDADGAVRELADTLAALLTRRVRETWVAYTAQREDQRRVRLDGGDESERADARAAVELARGMWLEAKRAQEEVARATV